MLLSWWRLTFVCLRVYRWWKKSCTIWDVSNPANRDIGYIYIYINYWIILHCRKLTARFFVKLVASRKTSLSFFIPFSNAEVSPRSFREGKYPPVNWISYNFVDRPVFSEKTLPKFFTASTRPWKVTIWGPPIGSRIIVFLSHHFARANR